MTFVFKEKEQEVIKFEDVKVGDRVKLVNENGDTAEVTSVFPARESGVYSETNSFVDIAGWSVAEILEKPMPNKPGTILRWTTDNSRYVKAGEYWYSLEDGDSYTENQVTRNYSPKKVTVEYAPE